MASSWPPRSGTTPPRLRTLRAARIPYVCLSRRADFLDSDFVGIDDDAAATTLMQHMLSHGFTEIATVIGPRFSTASLAREQAFVRTAAAAGITISGDRKISTRVDNEGGRLAAERLFSAGTPPQAVVLRQRRTCHRRHGIRLVARPAHPGRRRRRRL